MPRNPGLTETRIRAAHDDYMRTGHNLHRVGKRHGCSAYHLATLFRRLGLEVRPKHVGFWTAERLKEAYAIYCAEGVGLPELARRFGRRSVAQLHTSMVRAGYRLRKRGGHSWGEVRGPVTEKATDPIVRGEGHRCIRDYEGKCLGECGEVAA